MDFGFFCYFCKIVEKNTALMDIKKAEFLMSNTRFEFLPNDNIPEYAFIGRSNVGKSSLINMLVQRKGLAKTSSVPGKTVAINHFIVNDAWYLVDLPGYGYAQQLEEDSRAMARDDQQLHQSPPQFGVHFRFGRLAHRAAKQRFGLCRMVR